MNKSAKKKFKGMTLIEIIVSLAVFSVMTLVLVQASSAINMYIRSANNVNRTVAEQAPVAEIGQTDIANKVAEDVEIIIRDQAHLKDIPVKGDAYEVVDGDSLDSNQIGGNLNMQFIILDDVVPTTSPSP